MTRKRWDPPRRWVVNLGLSVVAVTLLSANLPLRGQVGFPRQLIVEPALLAKLQVLAAGLHTEIVLCLQGTIDGDTARATRFTMPEPRLSTFQRSAFLPCPLETLAAWHNHPPVLLERHGGLPPADPASRPIVTRPLDLCALSGKDIETAARVGHPFAVVAVDAETWCWWTLEQVRHLLERQATQGRSVPQQSQWASRKRGAESGEPSTDR